MAFLLCVSPLMRGGNRQVALVVLEAISLLFLLSVSLRQLMLRGQEPAREHEALSKKIALAVLLFSPAWLAVAFLIPLPSSVWTGLPGHDLYARMMINAGVPLSGSLPLSLVPD